MYISKWKAGCRLLLGEVNERGAKSRDEGSMHHMEVTTSNSPPLPNIMNVEIMCLTNTAFSAHISSLLEKEYLEA